MTKKQWLLISVIILGGIHPAYAYDEYITPTRTVWDGMPVKRQFSGSGNVNDAIYKQQLESLKKVEQEGSELETEPMMGEEAPDKEIVRVKPTPDLGKQKKKNFSFHPEKGYDEDELIKVPLPGEDVLVEEEETEIKTAPIFQDEQEGLNLNRPLNISASLDRNRVHLDESFTLRFDITIRDVKELDTVRLPELIHFKIINRSRTDSTESVKGDLWHHRTVQFVFLGEQPGVFRIPPLSVRYSGHLYKTGALKIRVEGTNSGVAYRRRFSGVGYADQTMIPGAPKTGSNEKDGVLFTAEVDKEEVYVNEQVTLVLRLRYTSDDKTVMIYTPPMVTGFITEQLLPVNREEQISSTKQRLLDKQFRTALFPIRGGNFTIGMGQVVLTQQGKQNEHLSDAISIKVMPLPRDSKPLYKNRPNSLVGEYAIKSMWGETQGEVDKPVRLTIAVSGTGNLRSSPEPFIHVPSGSRLYLEKTEERISPKQGRIQGSKYYHYLVVFKKDGLFKFGKTKIRFFNAAKGKWQTVTAAIPDVTVLPKPELARRIIQNKTLEIKELHLRKNHGQAGRLVKNKKPVMTHWSFIFIQLLGPLAIAAVVIVKRYRSKIQADQKTLRSKRAFKQANKAMRQLKHWIYDGEIRKFYDGLTRTTSEYLAAKFNVPTTYISAERLNDYFKKYNMPEALIGRFKVALTACEYVRYAAVTLPVRDMHALHKDLKQALREFELTWKAHERAKQRAAKTMMMIIFLISALSLGAVAQDNDRELVFTQGNAFAEKGELLKAEKTFQSLIKQDVVDAAVYYNLGNIYLEQGKLGEAVLAYERARWLDPHDRDCKYNLAKAKSLINVKDLAVNQPVFIAVIQKIFHLFTADELAVLTSIWYWLVILSVLLWLIWPDRFGVIKKWTWLAVIPLMLMLSWTTARYYEKHWWQEAVVLADQARLYIRPYPQAETLLALPEGLTVSVLEQEEGWVKISIGPNHHGWVKRHILGYIK